MTIHLGSAGTEFIAQGGTWRFFRGSKPPSDPPDAWKGTDFDDSGWETGASGFGYGDSDDATILYDMEGSYVTAYIRKEFSSPSLAPDTVVQLVIDYDDGFIAYLNGQEVARRHMPDGPATHETTASSHEAGTPETIALGTAGELLNDSNNLLAIEGHNTSADSSDFSLIPSLRTATDTVQNGETWIISRETVTLKGATNAHDAISVMIKATTVDFNPDDGTWEAEVSLAPGMNIITAEVLDADTNVVDSASIEIVYVPPENHVAGELAEDTTWSGAYILEGDVVVPASTVLNIEPGTMVLAEEAVSLVVYGQLLADGTESAPIRFTHYGDGTTWNRITFIEAADSCLAHCIIEYADSEGAHQDYYEPGPRTYHEAVVALASHLDIERCVFQKLPDESANAEGDAIAIISDDPDHPGDATAHIRGSQFLSIGQGVHTRYAYVLVEDCFFTGKHGDNDDVDLWGESTPPPLIRNNLFLNPDHDDMINPTRCSAVIIGNVIAGSDDHGVVLRDRGFPIMMNNLIYDCSSAGIAVENSCEALLVNNTIVDCGRGLRLFDLGRWNPPYSLNPGGGTATVINCIIWDCPQPITLTDSSNTEIEDPGSHITIEYCNVQGGQDGISVSGTHSTVTWGQSNVNADPQFADPGSSDYHVKSEAGRWEPTTQAWTKDDVTSLCIDAGDPNSDWAAELWPHGKRINMGAYGGTPEASMSLSAVGNVGDLNADDSMDARDLLILCEDWLIERLPTAADINRDSVVDFHDYAALAADWLEEISGDGLVAQWKLDETEGSIAHDSIGDNDATLHEAEWTEGRINGALLFNGFNTYVDCGESEVLGPEQMTLAMWLEPGHMGGMRYIVSRAKKGTDDFDYTLMRHLTGELEFAVGQLGVEPVSVLSTAGTPLGEWSHVAVCLDGSEASVYVNGQPDSSADYAERVPREGYRLVISSYQASTRFYFGKIDDVRIYNVALSKQGVEALYGEASAAASE
jgi:hypothetical protein